MSVLFLPPSAGAASVPDASETVSGKIRIATSAEATTGTNDLTAMTPAKVKTVVDAAVVGGVTYKGTFDTSSPVDLSNALQGDLYIISVAGSYQGQTWAVGDHLLINADMGGTLDPAKIDKVDNTDAVTSVAGRTGAVVLSSADISGLATVATSGAYSDLSGTPTLATVATTGAYSDLSGTPTLATVATTGAYSDLSGTPTLATVATTGAYSDLSGTPTLATVATTGAYSDLSGTPTLGTASAEDVGTSAGNVVQLDGTAKLPAVDGSQLLNLPSGASTLGALTDVDVTGAVATNVIKYDGTNWVDGSVAYSEVTGTPTLATVATTGAYSDLSGTPTLATVATTGAYSDLTGTPTLGTASAEDVGTAAGNVVQLDGSARLPAVDGSLLTNVSASVADLDDIGNVDTTGVSTNNVLKYDGANWVDGSVAYTEVTGTPSLATVATTGAYSDLSGTPTLAAIATTGDYSDLNDSVVVQQFNTTTTSTAINSNALHVFRLYGGGITLTLAQATVANGFALFHNISGSDVTITGASTSFRANGEGASGGSSSITVKAGERRLYYLESTLVYMEVNSTRLEHNGDVNITSVANNEVIKYNSTSGDWENGAVAYADVTGTPTLGTAAAEDVGTSANNVVQLDGTARLPAVDGSQLTSLPTAGYPALTSASPSSTYTISTSTGFMEIYLLNPSVAIVANIPAPSTVSAGYRYNIKNLSANSITITPASGNIDGASTLVLNVQYSAVTLVSDQTNWFII